MNNCEKDWVDILTALLTPTIAIVGGIIAWLQWKINQRRLIHELFEKRIAVFDLIAHYIGNIVADGTVRHGKDTEFLRDTRNAFFVFGKDIEDYVDEIYDKSIKLQTFVALLDRTANDPEKEDNIMKQRELREWFQKELNSIRIKFNKYLTLKV